jgi:hypothetical protein
MPQACFALVIFQIGAYIYAWAWLNVDPLIYIFHVARITGVCQHAQLFIG